jgi:hypothetical protein
MGDYLRHFTNKLARPGQSSGAGGLAAATDLLGWSPINTAKSLLLLLLVRKEIE